MVAGSKTMSGRGQVASGRARGAEGEGAGATSKEVRASLIEALRLDLIGLRPGHPPHAPYADEMLAGC